MCAIPTGAGPYNWGDYLATGGGRVDARSSALECDQTWVVETPRTASPFYPGVSEYNDFWQIWTGERVTVNGTNFRVMKGNVVFENEVVSQTSDNFIGYVGPAKLLLRNGGSLHASADDIKIGTAYNNGTDGTATVFMEEPSTLSAASGKRIYVGNNLPGALWMDGGLVAMTNAPFFSGTSSGDGYVRVNGGKIHLRETSDTPALIVGGVSYSSMHVSGGEVTASRSSVSSSLSQVGTGPSPAAELYADGGVLDFVNERFCVGQWGSVAGTSALTIDGTAEMTVNLLVMGNSDKAGTAIANFNGGKIKITRGLADYGKTLPTRQLNFDGGTVEGALDMAWPTTVYPGGGTINVPSGSSYAQRFLPRMATGNGVDAITLTNPGSGYVTAPRVTITGGSGSGASAYAVLAKDRTIERIVVTCRGEGYAEADELTVTIASTTGSGAAATATLAANGGGALRKTGPGTWTHKANASFDGTIEVKGGAINADGATLNVNKVAMRNGVGYLGATGNTAAGTIAIGTIDVDCGLAIVNSTNKFALTLADETLASASAGGSRIVNGLVYKNGDAPAYRSPSLFERTADGSLSLITTTSTIGPDANYSPSGSFTEANAPTVTSFNCVVLPLSPAVDCYVRSADKVEIKSGMIVYRRPQPDLQRFSVTGGGALTTRAPGGMFIYGDSYEPAGRSHS